MACSSDGFLRLWDLREPDRVSLEMSSTTDPAAELKPLLSCDVNLEGTVACAGSETLKEDAFILFWDLRNTRKLMGGYWDTHSKDVTQVRFHPSAKSFLLTGGVDGLVNVFDIDEACEDDALLYTLNAECAVSSVSWLKRTALDVDRLAIVTSEEEFQWWEADDAEPKFRRTREKLVEGNAGDNKIVVDHLVGMVTFDDGLSTLVSSSNDGKVELWTEAGVHLASLAASHHDLVRAAVAGRDETGQQKSLWTAGEDGIVCYWKEGAQCAGVAAKDFKAGSSIKTKSKLHKAKPY
ncbi:WD repeat-containing protein 89-like isoform X2 [Varroa jacobsoni]|nr:WD repeat-containing protein 89-like isoform X2 [Varroa destructor]XP_022710436.1 WD repeat-containing protein 89-like isoform X2 [Varroa jacobsoni]